MREAGEECGSQRNCRQSMNLILVCTHSKELPSFARLCPCTSVPNPGADSINCPTSWVALYITHNVSFLFVRESESRRHTYVYTEMVQRSGFCEILSPEKSTGRNVFWHLRRRQQRS